MAQYRAVERRSIPLVILAGSDRRAAALSKEGADRRPLRGSKGVDLRVGEQPLIEVLVETFRAVDFFGPIFVAGSAAAYGGLVEGLEVIDTDATFQANIEASLEILLARFPDQPVALATCDILPTVEELQRAVDDYRVHEPLNFWYPMIAVPTHPGALGESSWKPRYGAIPEGETDPVPILPGHLLIIRLEAARLDILLRCFGLAYETRNRPVLQRFWMLVRNLLAYMVWKDVRDLRYLQAPTSTVRMLSSGLQVGIALRDANGQQSFLEHHGNRLFLRRRYLAEHPDRKGRSPVLRNTLGLARDIDTREEAREHGLEIAGDDELRRPDVTGL